MNLSESKEFLVSSGSLKDVRTFSREVFDKINLPQDQKDELVLAISEAAQNIVKHGYKGVKETTDRMEIKISLNDSELEIGFFDKGKKVVPENDQLFTYSGDFEIVDMIVANSQGRININTPVFTRSFL